MISIMIRFSQKSTWIHWLGCWFPTQPIANVPNRIPDAAQFSRYVEEARKAISGNASLDIRSCAFQYISMRVLIQINEWKAIKPLVTTLMKVSKTICFYAIVIFSMFYTFDKWILEYWMENHLTISICLMFFIFIISLGRKCGFSDKWC